MNLWYGRGGLNVKASSLFHSLRETNREATSPKTVGRCFAISVKSPCHLRELKQRILNSYQVLEKSHTSLRVPTEASKRESQKVLPCLLVSSLGCREQFLQWMKLLIPISLVATVYMLVVALHPLGSSLFRDPR
jgi:hypothetical protein